MPDLGPSPSEPLLIVPGIGALYAQSVRDFEVPGEDPCHIDHRSQADPMIVRDPWVRLNFVDGSDMTIRGRAADEVRWSLAQIFPRA